MSPTRDSGINSVKDFKGKTVATWFFRPASTPALGATRAWPRATSAGEVNSASPPFSMQPFIDKQFDVATVTLYNELNTLREQGIDDIKLFLPDDSGVTTQQDLDRHLGKDDQGQARARAGLPRRHAQEGWKYAFEHKAEAVDIVLAAGSGLERKHQELMLDEIEKLMTAKLGKSRGLGAIDMTSIAAVQDSLVQFKALKAPVDLKAAFDQSFWDKVPAADKTL